MAQPEPRRKIKGVLFDLDGLLINSEHLYTKVTNEVIAPYGKKMDWEVKAAMMGRPGHISAQILIDRMQLPLTVPELMKKTQARQNEVFPTVEPMPGALKLVHHLRDHGIPMAIATGSHSINYKLKTSHLPDLFAYFEHRWVGADHKLLKRGKPHPDVFLIAAAAYLGLDVRSDPKTGEYEPPEPAEGEGIRTDEILVFEDGVPGVHAAQAAKMPVVWVPDEDLLHILGGREKALKEVAPDEMVMGLDKFDPAKWGLPPYSS